MNEKLMNQVAEMKKQTIGVEVEMNSIERSKAAKLAAEFFGTGRWQDTARRNGYSTWSTWDAQGREWKFQKDVSIHGPDSEKCEMVTPILTYADMDLLQGLVRHLRKAGAKSDATRGCGVHIHIGAKGHTPQSLRNLANIMASHERLLADALNLDRGRMSHYCKTVNLPGQAEPAKAHHDGRPCRGLVHLQQQELREPQCPLQREPLPYAQPPRHLHQGHD
jgi:hypothetical protein